MEKFRKAEFLWFHIMPSAQLASAFQPIANFFQRLTIVSPKEVKLSIGLDVGSTSVKALALGARKGAGLRPIVAQQLIPLVSGQDVDASGAIKSAVAALHLPLRSVNLSVSGQWVIMRIVEMPVLKPAEMKQALPFEAQRYLPFNVQDVIVDGEILGPADANKLWVLIVACKKELIERRIDWVRRAGLEVGLIDVDALALANSFLATTTSQRSEGTRALMNVGSQLTNLVIFQGTIPYLVRDIPWGSEKLSRSVAEQLGMTTEVVLQDVAQGSQQPELRNAIKLATETLVTELQLSFDYFENRFGQPPEQILSCGGLGQSTIFLEALKEYFTQTVALWVPVSGLSGQFAITYGLALRTT